MFFRIFYNKILGMDIGKNVVLGKIQTTANHCVKISDRCEIRDNVSFWIKNPLSFDENSIIIGCDTFIGNSVEFNCSKFIYIGDNCLIGSSVKIIDSSHSFDKDNLINTQDLVRRSVIIEDDVWIGSSSTILMNVTIGRGAIIGANSLVNKNVPAYEVWCGIPAKKMRDR